MDFEEIDALLSAKTAATAAGGTGEMTLRERFRRTMFFQQVDLRPNFEFGYWERTLEVWREQGLPDHVVDEATAYDYFGIENHAVVAVNSGPLAVCEPATLEETDDRIITRDTHGCVAEINKHGDRSIPHYLDFPIKDRESFAPFKEALDPARPERWQHFADSVQSLRNATVPVAIFTGSIVGTARNLIGFERIAMMAYEDPELLTDVVDTFGACALGVLERALPHVQVDIGFGWEDICFNSGPIVTPQFFRDACGPWYKRIADLLAAHGCCIYTTDTDGNINPIVDVFVENGLNTMFPVEVHAGTDPVALRERFGKRVKLWGGVCKMKLAASKEAIDAELNRLLPVVEQGGFIPTVDHRVPADVPYENYLYYLDRKRELFRVGGTPKY